MNETEDLISVIMPVFNAELYIADAMESILNQSYSNFEFIIINDGSLDKSLEIIKSYAILDDRIVLVDRNNKGLVESLNEGIQMASGKYIARMGADDISLERRFELQVSLLKNSDLDICGCHYFVIDEDDSYIRARIVPTTYHSIVMNLAHSVPFAHGSVMCKKDILLKHKYGDSPYKAAEDYALWFEMFDNNVRFGNVNEFLFKYRSFDGSFSGTKHDSMRTDRVNISKKFFVQYKYKLRKSIDVLIGKSLSTHEEALLMDTSLLLKCKIIDCIKKTSKTIAFTSILKYLINFNRL